MKRREQTRAGLGAASMVLILLVLCLALLGVLSLMTAQTDLSMSKRDIELNAAYAGAAAGAQRSLMELDRQLSEVYKQSADDMQYEEGCMEVNRACGAEVIWMDGRSAEMTFDAGADRELLVEIERCRWEEAGKKRFKVAGYTLMDASDWTQTDSLILMGM